MKGARQSPQSTGLYHFAVLVPNRGDLGSALAHLRRISYPLQGAADHLVSEALYLADSEGNGIEIYRDRPRSEWLRIGSEIRMDTLPLDLRDLSASAAADDAREVPPNTTLGHVHLRVHDVEQAVAFYRDGLGFDLTMRFGRDAAFFGAGGYHHHIGTNTWSTRGADPAPDGSAGLSSLTITLPTPVDLERTVGRLRDHGTPVLKSAGTYTTHDPAGIQLQLITHQHPDRS